MREQLLILKDSTLGDGLLVSACSNTGTNKKQLGNNEFFLLLKQITFREKKFVVLRNFPATLMSFGGREPWGKVAIIIAENEEEVKSKF